MLEKIIGRMYNYKRKQVRKTEAANAVVTLFTLLWQS